MQKEKSQSTILVISMGFLVLYFVFSWSWAVVVSLVVGIIGIFSTYLSRKIEWGWMILSKLLSYIIPNLLLSLVYFLLLFPLSLISKLFTKDPLMLSKNYDSYFVAVNKEMQPEDFEKTW